MTAFTNLVDHDFTIDLIDKFHFLLTCLSDTAVTLSPRNRQSGSSLPVFGSSMRSVALQMRMTK